MMIYLKTVDFVRPVCLRGDRRYRKTSETEKSANNEA